ncbi:peroxisomal ATPase PEX1-like [Mya arenaria]|uniref:peroxisomal ATPase PEX1-like n=1 Tax=Mya arenaria TaxID=6604 RepID=UPI0022E5AEC2|nr:peroxisomal ATPase PEX1-like [Mya arenaria]
MSLSVLKVQFVTVKNCFVTLTSGVFKDFQRDIRVLEVEAKRGKVFVSWAGDTVREESGSDGVLQINGWFGDKLGLKDGEQLIVRPCQSAIKEAIRVCVEPLSESDWEILERHTDYLESHLLDIVRVVQPGGVYPVWVEKTVCIFIRIADTTPTSECVILVNETEVFVTPKLRSSAIGRPAFEEPMRKDVTNNLGVPFINPPMDDDDTDSKFSSTDSTDCLTRHKTSIGREKSPTNPFHQSINSQWKSLVDFFGFTNRASLNAPSRVIPSDDEMDDFDDDYYEDSEMSIQPDLNMVLRVQNMKYTLTESDHVSMDLSPSRRGSESPKKSTGGLPPRKQSRESHSKSRSPPKSSFRRNYVPQQPSTVYMDMTDVERQLKLPRGEIPHTFMAKLHKLKSPKEVTHEKLSSSSGSMKSQPGVGKPENGAKDSKATTHANTPMSPADDLDFDGDNQRTCVVVRVIVIDRRRQLCSDSFSDIIKRVLQEQPLLKGHVVIPDMLRRFLKLDITSRVWIQTFKAFPVHTTVFSLYPLGNVPKSITGDKLAMAFREWLDQISNEDFPLIVTQGLFIRFFVLHDVHVECQLTYNEMEPRGNYTELHPTKLRNCTLTVVSGSKASNLTPPVIQPMLAYTSLHSLDPFIPPTNITSLGGMEDQIETALVNIEICLGARRLYRDIFLSTPGLLNGMLLLTGSKGSGKTTLANALCKKVTELPNLAFTCALDCKPLRGKKVDTIQKMFELMFDEAVWRQPSIIFLDDLDHIAGAPAGPETEMSGEALYSARVAEVVKDLLRKDIRNLSNIAVIATCKSRSSLHPVLVSSRGTHLVQEVLNIAPPNKDQRRAILKTILKTKKGLPEECVEKLDLDQLSCRTEGYVARDLENIINRAVHAHLLAHSEAPQDNMEIDQGDFEAALTGFTPASIRNVPLHEAGGLGWEDIGGLTDVKTTLVETLLWPAKYPQLFANCPLRLRSGLLLYGAPGTGKTLLAGVVAKECGLNFISIKGPELLSKYIGASEQAVRDTFVRAQSAKPCILFFDEFDSIAPRRGHDNTGVTDRVVNQLLTQLDGVEGLNGVYVLAATSRPDLIDPALLRPGRLDKCLHCQMPNQKERLKILEALARKISLAPDVDLNFFAEHCKDFTGADFKALLYNGQLEAIHEFTSAVEGGAETDIARYGMKPTRGPTSRLKSSKLRLNVETKRARHRSFSSGTVAYIPSLEEGVVQVTADMEEKLNLQVSQIRMRERRTSEHFLLDSDSKPESPFQVKQQLQVRQDHLMTGVGKMRPSVSGEERVKYQRIYENFLSSRGKHFDGGHFEPGNMKATLA